MKRACGVGSSKSPKLNGAVERANASWRYEFYAVYDLPDTLTELNPLIDSFQHLHNHTAPCRASPRRRTLPPTTAWSSTVSNVLTPDNRFTAGDTVGKMWLSAHKHQGEASL